MVFHLKKVYSMVHILKTGWPRKKNWLHIWILESHL